MFGRARCSHTDITVILTLATIPLLVFACIPVEEPGIIPPPIDSPAPNQYVTLETSLGQIVIEAYTGNSTAADHLVSLANSSYYNDTLVHEIGDVILRLNEEQGLTVLLVEQKLPFARRVAKDFCIMEKGRNMAVGPIDELNEALVSRHLSV